MNRPARSAGSGLVLPAALEPDAAVMPVVDHEDRARGQQRRSPGHGARAGHQRARRAVVAALAEDPQPAAGGVVVEGLAQELW